MFERLKSYRIAMELKAPQYQRTSAKSARDRRSLISICVIDDNPFDPKRNLENIGYRITYLGDINTVDVVTPHHIVLCDLKGVGHELDARKQGSFVIREIRANYPEKYVIAYTGGGANEIISREAYQVSDSFLKKDADIDAWVNTLDRLILRLLDPYTVWQRQRSALIEREVDTLTILKLEDAYVRSITLQSDPEHSTLSRLLSSDRISDDVRAIVRSLIASGLIKLLMRS
jgi:hypothetical protein